MCGKTIVHTMIETVQIDFQFVLVQQLVVTARRAASLHRPKVLAPARSPRVLFQSLLFRSSAQTNRLLNKTLVYSITQRVPYLF